LRVEKIKLLAYLKTQRDLKKAQRKLRVLQVVHQEGHGKIEQNLAFFGFIVWHRQIFK